MQPEPYLPRLTARLGDGLLRLPDDFRARHADFVRRRQNPDVGFPGRDGGYAKNVGAAAGSTYHTFLVGLCYQLLGRDFPRPGEVRHYVITRRREDGGYVEIAPMRRSGTNPTAAAVGVLQLTGAGIPD